MSLKEGSGDDVFDVNPVIGYDSYITSMTYVASEAMEKIAKLVGDKDTAERARRLSETSLKELRWKGKFYEAWEESPYRCSIPRSVHSLLVG